MAVTLKLAPTARAQGPAYRDLSGTATFTLQAFELPDTPLDPRPLFFSRNPGTTSQTEQLGPYNLPVGTEIVVRAVCFDSAGATIGYQDVILVLSGTTASATIDNLTPGTPNPLQPAPSPSPAAGPSASPMGSPSPDSPSASPSVNPSPSASPASSPSPSPLGQVVSLSIVPNSIFVSAGTPLQVHATAFIADQGFVDVTERVAWAIEDAGIASITPAGLVVGVNYGDTTLSASLGGKTATAPLTVGLASINPPPPPSSGPSFVVTAGAHSFVTDTGMLDGVVVDGWNATDHRWDLASGFQLASGATLTVTGSSPFWLKASGSVSIDGNITAAGQDGGNGTAGSPGTNGAGGPGGSAGQAGPGQGGTAKAGGGGGGGGAGHLMAGTRGGNSSLTNGSGGAGGSAYVSIPTTLVGGSGGGRGGSTFPLGPPVQPGGGGGGGGAVRLEATGSVTVSASGGIDCHGGNGGRGRPGFVAGGGGGGSGGSIELIGSTVTKAGSLLVSGGAGGLKGNGAGGNANGGAGSPGRILPP